MTNHVPCRYDGRRESAIIEFLYGELDAGERAAFEQHLTACGACRVEVEALRGVRQVLAGWAPPEPMRVLEHTTFNGPRLTEPAASGSTASRSIAAAAVGLPAWARVAAAAVLCLGIGAGAANLRVTYSPAGLTVTTGWLSTPAPAASVGPAPWQTQMTALESRLRDELRALRTAQEQSTVAVAAAAAPAEAVDADTVMRQVKALIARSEQRQQNELALRLGGVLAEVQSQRRADLARIDRTIGVVQSNTGMEVLRQREMLNSLAVRVSTQR